MTRRVLLLLVLLAGLGLAGCTDSGSSSSAQSAVEKAYLAYWEAVLAANESPGAEHDLESVATGEQLQADRMLVQQREQAGEQVSGGYEHSASVTSVAGTEATVEDCMTADLTVSGPQGEQEIPAGPYAVTASLAEVDGMWLVARLSTSQQQCTVESATASPGTDR
jgi:hypothetical protein